MSTLTDRPDVSLVLEHVNAMHVSRERIQETVRELARQVREAPFTAEVLVPDRADIDVGLFAGVDVRRFGTTAGANYYEVKNDGARAAKASVIAFADCDVMPLDGWLVNLVRPLDDPTADAVVGTTTIRPVSTVTEKAFAATSWFPAHDRDARRQIVANNLAVRSRLFLPDGFPDLGCRYRGADTDLDRAWAASGVRLEVSLDARTEHPPPEHPVPRAQWDGHDQQIGQHGTGAFVPSLARVVLHQLVIGSGRLLQNRRAVGLRWEQLPLAFLCNAREAAFRGLGFALARFAHGTMHRRVPW